MGKAGLLELESLENTLALDLSVELRGFAVEEFLEFGVADSH